MYRPSDDAVILKIVDGNPKREGSAAHARFELYVSGMTVGEFIRAGGLIGDIYWVSHVLTSSCPTFHTPSLRSAFNMMDFAERSFWTGDDLGILRGVNSAAVDLIWLKPGFDCERDCGAAVGRAGAGAAFKDAWRCPIWTWHGWG